MARLTIGRSDDNDLVYSDPRISSYHADLDFNGNHVTIIDHSTNGTWVNGRMLHHATCQITMMDKVVFPGNIHLDWHDVENALRHKKTVICKPSYTIYDSRDDSAAVRRVGVEQVKEDAGDRPAQKSRRESALSFGAAISNVFSHYADFSGRARRSEYWWFYLLSLILSCIPYVGFVWMFVALIPSLAVCVRRLHDIGKSGWNLLLGLIPIAGVVILIVWYCKEGDNADNQYGPDPKAA